MGDLNWIFDDNPIETKKIIPARMKRAKLKRARMQVLKRENANELLSDMPQPGESFHFIGNGAFDCWTLTLILIDVMGGHSENLYTSTWTMNRDVLEDLFSLFDTAKIGGINAIVSVSFKRRKTGAYMVFTNGMEERKQKHLCVENHSKITLLNSGDDYIVIEGSANMTANPRLEQMTIINDYDLWRFHRDWMVEVLDG